jgi:hypothetical protein
MIKKEYLDYFNDNMQRLGTAERKEILIHKNSFVFTTPFFMLFLQII